MINGRAQPHKSHLAQGTSHHKPQPLATSQDTLTQAILATELSTVRFSPWKQLKTYIKIINGRAQPHPPHWAHDTIKLDHIAPPSTNQQLSPIFFTNATSPYPAPSYFAIR